MMTQKLHAFEVCGVYEVEGYIHIKSKNLQLVLNKGAESQIDIDLGTFHKKSHMDLIDDYFRVAIEVEKKCKYDCTAKLVNKIKRLHPLDDAKIFHPRMVVPHTKKNCL